MNDDLKELDLTRLIELNNATLAERYRCLKAVDDEDEAKDLCLGESISIINRCNLITVVRSTIKTTKNNIRNRILEPDIEGGLI